MFSAVDFLPSLMIAAMNLLTTLLLYFGSGSTSLFSATLLLGIIYSSIICSVYLGFFVPYFDLLRLLSFTPVESSVPLIIWYLTPGKSLTLPPLIMTIECSCRLCPTPGIYAVTSIALVSLTLATFLKAEFGFFGVVV